MHIFGGHTKALFSRVSYVAMIDGNNANMCGGKLRNPSSNDTEKREKVLLCSDWTFTDERILTLGKGSAHETFKVRQERITDSAKRNQLRRRYVAQESEKEESSEDER